MVSSEWDSDPGLNLSCRPLVQSPGNDLSRTRFGSRELSSVKDMPHHLTPNKTASRGGLRRKRPGPATEPLGGMYTRGNGSLPGRGKGARGIDGMRSLPPPNVYRLRLGRGVPRALRFGTRGPSPGERRTLTSLPEKARARLVHDWQAAFESDAAKRTAAAGTATS